MSKWQPMDSREWDDSSPSVIVAVNRAADLKSKIYAVGEAQYHGEVKGWWWAGSIPSEYWGAAIYPEFWQPLPEAPPSVIASTAGEGKDCDTCHSPI